MYDKGAVTVALCNPWIMDNCMVLLTYASWHRGTKHMQYAYVGNR